VSAAWDSRSAAAGAETVASSSCARILNRGWDTSPSRRTTAASSLIVSLRAARTATVARIDEYGSDKLIASASALSVSASGSRGANSASSCAARYGWSAASAATTSRPDCSPWSATGDGPAARMSLDRPDAQRVGGEPRPGARRSGRLGPWFRTVTAVTRSAIRSASTRSRSPLTGSSSAATLSSSSIRWLGWLTARAAAAASRRMAARSGPVHGRARSRSRCTRRCGSGSASASCRQTSRSSGPR